MDERKKTILMAIIQDYLSSAEPVGSRTIAYKYRLGVSPATIRNEMADLENLGYLEQPHASAGRVPSAMGYHYYIDCMMQKENITPELKVIIRQGLEQKVHDVGEVIRRTNQLLAKLTSYTALVLTPHILSGGIKHIQLVPLNLPRVTLLVVLDSGGVKNYFFDVPESIGENDLATISSVLNAKLKGFTLETIKRSLLNEVFLELSRYRQVLNRALEVLFEHDEGEAGDKIYLDGLFNIINQPEFRNLDKVKTLLSLLSQENLLRSLLSGVSDGVTVRIGNEVSLLGTEECSIVLAPFGWDQMMGTFAVLGPTRMDYSRVISIVDFITRSLSITLSQFFGGAGL